MINRFSPADAQAKRPGRAETGERSTLLLWVLPVAIIASLVLSWMLFARAAQTGDIRVFLDLAVGGLINIGLVVWLWREVRK